MILDLIIFFLVIFIVYKLLQKHIVDEDFKDVVTEPEKPVTLTVDEYIPIIYDKTEVVVPYLDYTCKEYADYKFNKFLETEKELMKFIMI